MSDQEVLTEEESDALLEQSENPQSSPTNSIQDPGDGFWEQVSLERIPALESLNAGIADALVRVWDDMFSRQIVVSAQLPCHTDGRRLAESVEFDESIRSFELSPLGDQCLIILRPDTVSAMVDLCFGGPGSGARSERLAALTEMEGRLFGRFCDAIRDALNEVWRADGELALEHTGLDFDSATHVLCEPAARSVASRFMFDISQDQHVVEFVWPHKLIELLGRSAPMALPAHGGGESQWSRQIGSQVKGARIELRAVIDGISIRLHEISTAKAGDIIMTDQLEKVSLFAGPQPVFEGTLGSHEGFNAVKIRRPYIQKRFGDS